MPTYWKTKINQNNFVCKNRKQNVARNCYLKLLCKDKKGSRTLYNIIVGNQDSSPPSQKWVNILGNITQEEWNSYNDTIKNIKEVKLQEFQFKVNNHILVKKSFLHKINKVDNDRCTFCSLETETIIHVLFNCNKVKEFWLAMKNWLRIQANVILHLTIKNVIFSKQENNELLNYILLLGKYFIYKTKFLANSIRVENFITYLKRKYQNEKYISKIHNKQNNEAELLEGDIKYSELAEALKNMKNLKTPGNDGFTAEFFKFFWTDLKFFILNSLNYGYRTGSLSITQKQGIITCLPKPNKSPFYLKNWRPISLLNVIDKLASSVIAARLKTVLHKLIHEDQKGFISGRFIGENIRQIYDILFETKQHKFQTIKTLIIFFYYLFSI